MHSFSLQQQERLSLANKLNSNHIGWQKKKKKVKLVAQTFILSTADSFEFLEHDLKDQKLKGCSSTIEFICNIDILS